MKRDSWVWWEGGRGRGWGDWTPVSKPYGFHKLIFAWINLGNCPLYQRGHWTSTALQLPVWWQRESPGCTAPTCHFCRTLQDSNNANFTYDQEKHRILFSFHLPNLSKSFSHLSTAKTLQNGSLWGSIVSRCFWEHPVETFTKGNKFHSRTFELLFQPDGLIFMKKAHVYINISVIPHCHKYCVDFFLERGFKQ